MAGSRVRYPVFYDRWKCAAHHRYMVIQGGTVLRSHAHISSLFSSLSQMHLVTALVPICDLKEKILLWYAHNKNGFGVGSFLRLRLWHGAKSVKLLVIKTSKGNYLLYTCLFLLFCQRFESAFSVLFQYSIECSIIVSQVFY